MLELSKNGLAFFASDLHLSPDTPKTLEAFENWLASISQDEVLVFLLGDLFEVWLGDDYIDETAHKVQKAILASQAAGAKLYFMQGNRDFLLGENFCSNSGMELLLDPEFLRVDSKIILLSHGDQLCTDDVGYQKFRAISRADQWIESFLAKSIDERKEFAKQAREQSAKHKKNSAHEIMDVNPKACSEAFAGRWPDGTYLGKSNIILHGHTHRCAVHSDQNPGLISESYSGELINTQRIVLPDWDFDTQNRKGHKGGFLTLRGDETFDITLFN